MYFIAAACGANIALDYLFIGALGLGAAGRRWVRCSQTLSVLIALCDDPAAQERSAVKNGDLRPRKAVLRPILRWAFPLHCRMVLFRLRLLSLPSLPTSVV